MIMIAQELTPLWETIVRLRWLLLIIGCLYLGSLAGGVVVGRFAPPAFQSLFAVDESQTTESVEKIFGRFRAPVREGRVTTIVVCSGNALCPTGPFARGKRRSAGALLSHAALTMRIVHLNASRYERERHLGLAVLSIFACVTITLRNNTASL
jgi:hypothetical protein